MSYFHKKTLMVPIYKARLVIIFSDDAERIKKESTALDRKDIYAHTLYGGHNGIEAYFIVLNFKNNTPIYNGVISHEVIHACNMLAETRGFIPTFSNDEPIAYMAEWIADQVYKFMEEKGMHCSIRK